MRAVLASLVALFVAVSAALGVASLEAVRRARQADHEGFEPSLFVFGCWGELKPDDVRAIAAIPGLRGVDWFRGQFLTERGGYIHVLMEATVDNHTYCRREFFTMPSEVEARWRSDPRALVTDEQTAHVMGWRVGQPATLDVRDLGPTKFTFAGTYEGYLPRHTLVHYEHVESLRPPEKRDQPIAIVSVRFDGDPATFKRAIEDKFRGRSCMPMIGDWDFFQQHIMREQPSRIGRLVRITLAAVAVTLAAGLLFLYLRRPRPRWVAATAAAAAALGTAAVAVYYHPFGFDLCGPGGALMNNIRISVAACVLVIAGAAALALITAVIMRRLRGVRE